MYRFIALLPMFIYGADANNSTGIVKNNEYKANSQIKFLSQDKYKYAPKKRQLAIIEPISRRNTVDCSPPKEARLKELGVDKLGKQEMPNPVSTESRFWEESC